MRMMRSARRPKSSECVISTIVMPRSRCNLAKRSKTVSADFGVEIAGRLVGQQQQRVVGQGPGDGHALPFAHGKLLRRVVDAVAQFHQFQQFDGLLGPLRPGADVPSNIGTCTFSIAESTGRR